MDEKVIIHVIPYIVCDSGFNRALNSEEAKAVGLRMPAFEGKTHSYIESLSLLKEKLTLIQGCLNATNEG